MATMPAILTGRPLRRTSQITDFEARASALRLLLNGGDEPERSTRARGWRYESEDRPMEWFEDLQELDAQLSEEMGMAHTILPTGTLVEKIGDAVEQLGSWYAVSLPPYQKRLMHHAYDEMVGVGQDLKTGKINVAEASTRFDTIMAEVNEIVDFSKYQG